MKKRIKAGLGLFFGLVIGVPSIEEIFQMIFIDQFKSGNPCALFGLIPAFLIGFLLILNSIAIFSGYENIGEAWEELN